MYIHSNNIYTPTGCIDAIMHVENGKIIEFLDSNENVTIDLECNDLRVIPGLIDTHNHGTMGFTLMGKYDHKEDLVRGYLKGLASQGVTACMPTAEVEYFKAIVNVCKEEIDGALPIGIHSEGPYLNRVGENGIKEGYPEIKMEYLEKMVNDAGAC